jgi:DNA polymerase III epsilon subunit-like protein
MIFDIETDGLLDQASIIHVVAYMKNNEIHYTHDYDEMRDLFLNSKLLIGHNIIRYDVPVLEKLLGIKIKARLIDTLALSWYLNHNRLVHGLESYGEDYNIPKPKIDDWSSLSLEEYANRCIEDVKINNRLWSDLKTKLLSIYETKVKADKLIEYLSFKMDCLREQERSKWKFDKEKAVKTLTKLLVLEAQKVEELKLHMPSVPIYAKRTRPAKPYKKDGSLSTAGAKWFSLLKKQGYNDTYRGEIKVVVGERPPNPGSSDQVKDWLYSLGWKPESFDYKKDEDGNERRIPQVRILGEEGKELCPSVKELIEKHPEVAVLDGLTVIQHRIAILEGFLKNEKQGWLVADAAGVTNTLRFKHRVLVNLPGVSKAWGEDIRGCLIAPEGYVLCGSDVSSLEENTKKHYMYPYDPDYVREMSTPGFDAHLDLAKLAGVVTQQEIQAYVEKKPDAKNLKPIRQVYKPANYSCIYGVGAPKLSRATKLPVKETQKIIDIYWERNWSVKKIVEDALIKTVDGEVWLYNPVSHLWYNLRNKKDTFSTLNQGTGVYCFDMWIMNFRKKRPQLTGQFHDEVILCIKRGYEEKCKKLLDEAMQEVNKQLNLNVILTVESQFGKAYSDIH